MALTQILREGLETVLFIVAKFQQGLISSLGSLPGLTVAAGIGGMYFPSLNPQQQIKQHLSVSVKTN